MLTGTGILVRTDRAEVSSCDRRSFVISGLLLGAMIGISWYGARTLPPDARIPLHFGIGTYNNFASKTTGLIIWPVGGVVVFAF